MIWRNSDGTKGEVICARINAFGASLFWRHVGEGTHHRAGLC